MNLGGKGKSIAVKDEQLRIDAIKLLSDLEAAGAADEVSLTFSDPSMSYERWEAIGRFLGSIGRRSLWYIGDWLIFGEAVFGEAAAQGVEATTQERYSEAERVTGLDHGTLMNARSICARVARSRRRPELGVWMHEPVAKLEPKEQVKWLDHAVKKGWTRDQLRRAVKADDVEAAVPPDRESGSASSSFVSVQERIEAAARDVMKMAQPTGNGVHEVPDEVIARLHEAFGQE